MAEIWKKVYKKMTDTTRKTGRFLSSALPHSEKVDADAVTLAVVAIIKNEAAYIEEWVKYHILVGVERFYLYDNGSTDETRTLLAPYIQKGLIVLKEFPGQKRQLPAYNDAIKNYKHQTRYMAFIDADEFLFSCEPDKSVRQEVEEMFSEYPNAGGFAINWRMFGSSGHVKKPEGGVLENFLYRAKEDKRGNRCIKTIADPRRIYQYAHSHYPTYYRGYYSLDERGNRVDGWGNTAEVIKRIRINHYYTKSEEEWVARRKLGRVDGKGDANRSIEDFHAYDYSDIYDDGMLPFVEKIKKM